eukprot:9047477-Pyramimonas_sp.AAC.1
MRNGGRNDYSLDARRAEIRFKTCVRMTATRGAVPPVQNCAPESRLRSMYVEGCVRGDISGPG